MEAGNRVKPGMSSEVSNSQIPAMRKTSFVPRSGPLWWVLLSHLIPFYTILDLSVSLYLTPIYPIIFL